jgi:hypothetical protein
MTDKKVNRVTRVRVVQMRPCIVIKTIFKERVGSETACTHIAIAKKNLVRKG